MIPTPRSVLTWPLRQFGLDGGHTLSNANPTAAQTRAAQIEQFAYLTTRIAAADQNVAVLTCPQSYRDLNTGVDVVVLRDGKLARLSLVLDKHVLDQIYGG